MQLLQPVRIRGEKVPLAMGENSKASFFSQPARVVSVKVLRCLMWKRIQH